MSIKKILAVCVMLICSTIMSQFQQNIAYVLSFPDQSTWGLFNGQGTAGVALAQSAGVSLLQKCTISNNSGKKGIVKGMVSEFQLVPSSANGVVYWNPISAINAIQPCFLETFVSNSSQLSQACQSPEVLLIDNSKTSVAASVFTNTWLDQRYKTLSTAPDVVFGTEYQKLYTTLQKNLNNLLAIKQQMSNTDNFFSVLYLKFAATYGNQFVNQAAIQQLSSSIFGSDIDISTYFQGGVFPIACDLTARQGFEGAGAQDGLEGGGNGINCGPLVRASQMGFMKNGTMDVTPLLTQIPQMAASDIQSFLQGLASGVGKNNIVYNRARITELFFLYLGILMGSNIVASAPTYDQSFCSDSSCPGGSWCPVPSPCEKMNTAPFSFYSLGSHYCFAQVCSKLAAVARYVALLHDTASPKNIYKTQPVDTFYGMIVLNQSSYTIENGESRIAPGQVGILKGSCGVDVWNANGVNPDSNYKYRSVICNLFKEGQSKVIELRVEENFDIAHYDVSKTYVPAIKILNGATKTQKDIVAKGYLEDFFKVNPAVGWAVVLQVVEQQDSSNSSSFMLNMVGMARLNPYDFPLVYQGDGLGVLGTGQFSGVQLWQAPFLVYTKIVASQQKSTGWTIGSNNPIPQFTPLGTQTLAPFTVTIPGSSSTKTITPDPINPYYVAYQSALSADYGSNTSLQVGLQSSIGLIKKSYFKLDNLAVTPLIALIKKASANPHDIIVQITTTEDYRLTT